MGLGWDMERSEYTLAQAKLLISRLERIPADSIWAHRSSGHRGALLRWVEKIESRPPTGNERPAAISLDRLETLVESGYMLLGEAAKEISGAKTRR